MEIKLAFSVKANGIKLYRWLKFEAIPPVGSRIRVQTWEGHNTPAGETELIVTSPPTFEPPREGHMHQIAVLPVSAADEEKASEIWEKLKFSAWHMQIPMNR